ncbi:MAG: hypothetical protein RBT42_14185 [Aquabacterium sp.]|jgi:hypothetical protein|uniref:hypothetical protein n=1 Tax=Aquabacterium sp. TaxID=1872578 RepID=UPI002A36D864|nr:hypothetical protein [Aquabacterium sp.]MDX9844891.1 hypothetical protein [Aquabacterium sp.]
MSISLSHWRLPVLLALAWLAPGLHAQTAASAPPSRPNPLQADATVPPLRHNSALSRYKAHTEVEVGAWRQANDLTAQIGGWRAYAREAHAPDAPATPPRSTAAASAPTGTPSAPPKPPAASAPGDHSHHHHHGGQP